MKKTFFHIKEVEKSCSEDKMKAQEYESLNAVTSNKTNNSQFPIVGIGCSAGGLEALESFFMNMPKNNGMAFVVIQHLNPNYISLMPELLQRITPMKVFQASDNLKVTPDCIYVIPPNKCLSILNESLYLIDLINLQRLQLPIDVFFRSLAADRLEKSIGIILSGAGSDGSLGVKAIKEKKGIVLVQTPDTARFTGMPGNAAAAVIPDILAPVEKLPAMLIEFLNFVPKVKLDSECDDNTKLVHN